MEEDNKLGELSYSFLADQNAHSLVRTSEGEPLLTLKEVQPAINDALKKELQGIHDVLEYQLQAALTLSQLKDTDSKPIRRPGQTRAEPTKAKVIVPARTAVPTKRDELPTRVLQAASVILALYVVWLVNSFMSHNTSRLAVWALDFLILAAVAIALGVGQRK